jgi:alkanesulfonate monooxygenase SsuD/methylene tetrahydromethanopterin reductase-like flavin-dependent oxidoreductase (luciferase family)
MKLGERPSGAGSYSAMMDVGLLSLGDLLPEPKTGARLTPAARQRQIVQLGALAEEAGFDSFSVGEHHLCDYTLSAPPVILAAVAALTQRIRLSTGVTLLGSLDPVRVAEDYGTLDGISGGRVELVAGRGILRRTYRDLGYDPDESRALFTEHVEVLLALWSDEAADWPGRGLEGATVQPRPEQTPHPPLWIGGGSSHESIDLAARLGLPLMLPSVLAPPQVFAPVVERYRERFQATPHGSAPRVGTVTHTHLATDSQEARQRWAPYQTNYLAWVTNELIPWGEANVGPRDAQMPAGPPPFEMLCDTGVANCGSPAEIVDRICETRDALGIDLHLAMFDQGGIPDALLRETIGQFATDVLPKIQSG